MIDEEMILREGTKTSLLLQLTMKCWLVAGLGVRGWHCRRFMAPFQFKQNEQISLPLRRRSSSVGPGRKQKLEAGRKINLCGHKSKIYQADAARGPIPWSGARFIAAACGTLIKQGDSLSGWSVICLPCIRVIALSTICPACTNTEFPQEARIIKAELIW